MAGFITSIKNALFFALFSIPGIYIFILLKNWGLEYMDFVVSNYEKGSQNYKTGMSNAHLIELLSFVALYFLVGIPLFKFFSDTVEDGVVEF